MVGISGGAQRRLRRWGLLAAVAILTFMGAMAASAALSSDFVDEAAITGLTGPTNVEIAPDGRVFVAEKSGLVKVFDSVDDTTATVFADLRANVHDYWDRGLLGLAIHPDFPSTPFVYVLYTHGAPLSGATPTWGDGCPTPPGGTNDGCVVSGRLSRLEASGSQMTGPEVVLIQDWCQQYPSHSIGDLTFGPDGALYASGGDGASFNWTDYGQGGGDPGSPTPTNPCADPPVGVGGAQEPPGAEGGALRSQDLRTAGDPVSLDGTIIRVDPSTGGALPDNPAFGAANMNEKRIVAYGLRNPYRMTIDPATGAVYTGDVGWNTWEEVNRALDPTGDVVNFGWPCYEGGNGTSTRQSGYDTANLDICEDLYVEESVTSSLFAYHHNSDITGADECPPANPPQGTSSSISGLAFYEGGDYPGVFNGALFGSDYSRNCIWVMYRGASGDLDPATVEIFQPQAPGPVDLEIGPEGDLYYVSINQGEIRRIRFVGDNTPPVAAITANPASGSAPLAVDFDGSGSSDADLDAIVDYEWDLDGDGVYDDASGVSVDWVYDVPGSYTARLRVTDARGESDTASVSIQASNEAPTATILLPQPTNEWHVGETISFSGRGDDPDEGSLPGSSLSWDLVVHHCETDGSCHQHLIQTYNAASGSFTAPDHEYPSWLELRLTATDQFGVGDTTSVELQPELVDLTFDTQPPGLEVSYFGEPQITPFAETLIVGATVEVSTPATQSQLVYQSWSNGGPRVQTFSAPATATTYTATFAATPTVVDDTAITQEDTNVTIAVAANDSDPDGLLDPTSVAVVTPPDNGRATVRSGGEVLYEPDLNWNGVDTFTYRIRDFGGKPAGEATVTVTVRPVNDPPVADAGPDRSTLIGETVVLDGSRSSDPVEGSAVVFQWSIVSQPSGSKAPLVGATDAQPRFSPDEAGNYTIRLRVVDGSLARSDTVVVRASEVRSTNPPGDTFTDDDSSIFEAAIEWLAEEGITEGCNPPLSDRFCPEDFVTRGQMAAFFARALGWSDDGGGDLFVDDDGLVLEHAIDLMGAAGVTQGCNPPVNDRFCPEDFVTRGQMAAFFKRALSD